MKRLVIIIGFTAALCAVSCGKKQDPVVIPGPASEMVFAGSLSPITRSSFLDNTLTTLKWDTFDNIGLYALKAGTVAPANIGTDGRVSPGDATINPDFTAFQQDKGIISIDGTNPSLAVFTTSKTAQGFMPDTPAEGVDDVYAFYAYYPMTGDEAPTPVASDGEYGVALTVADVQNVNISSGAETLFGQYQICSAGNGFSSLYARSALLTGENRVNLQFNPVTSLIRFRMQTPPENTKSYTISQVKLILDYGNLSGDVILFPQNDPYPSSGTPAWPLVSVATDFAAHFVTLVLDSDITLGNEFTDYLFAVVIPTNDTTTEMSLSFVAYDAAGLPVLSTTKVLPQRVDSGVTKYGFRPGKIYTLDLQLDEFSAEAGAGKYNVYDWE